MARVYEEIIDFIAAGSTQKDIASWVPSQGARERVAELLDREKSEKLTAEEQEELRHYMELEHLMRLAKAKARRCLSNE